MTQVELETLIIRIMADINQALSEYKRVTEAANQFAQRAQHGAQQVSHAHQKLGLSLRDTRHLLHILSSLGAIPHPLMGGAMQGVYAFRLLGHAVSALGPAGMIAGAAIAAALAPVLVYAGKLWLEYERD